MTDPITSLEERIEETKKKVSGEMFSSFYTKQVLQNQIVIMQSQVEILKLFKGEKTVYVNPNNRK